MSYQSNSANNQKRKFGWLEFALLATLICLLVQFWPIIYRKWEEWPSAGKQTPGTFRHVIRNNGDSVEIRYWVSLPKNYEENSKWPLLLFLHGSGERGDDLEKLTKKSMPHLIAEGREFPMIVVSPQCPSHANWESVPLMELIDEIEKRFSVEKKQVYVMGFSMGGYGTWSLASRKPERFAAIVPMAGGGDPEKATLLVDLPVWAFHGENDDVVPAQQSIEMVKAIEAAGGKKVKLTSFPNTKHGIQNLVVKRPDLWEWLLQQKRD